MDKLASREAHGQRLVARSILSDEAGKALEGCERSGDEADPAGGEPTICV